MKEQDNTKRPMSAMRGKAFNSSRNIRSVEQLLESGLVDVALARGLDDVVEALPLSITPELANMIDISDPSDPIRQQFVPTATELNVDKHEMFDPIGDETYQRRKGLIHRYPDRVLLKPVNVCPVYCRFCFRREKVGNKAEMLTERDLTEAIDYIRETHAIWEVILTGGDPLTLSDRRLQNICARLHAIEHVGVIRIHTRYPVASPSRITNALVQAIKGRAAVYVVLHCNHPREFTGEVKDACARLIDNGIPMLSQTVLLKGINDDALILEELMRLLVRSRIKPYYLHHLDLARGTGHFRTSVAKGQHLMRRLRGRVSGLCQPTYVLDIPGGYGKVPIGPEYIRWKESSGSYQIDDFNGESHDYVDFGIPDQARRHDE